MRLRTSPWTRGSWLRGMGGRQAISRGIGKEGDEGVACSGPGSWTGPSLGSFLLRRKAPSRAIRAAKMVATPPISAAIILLFPSLLGPSSTLCPCSLDVTVAFPLSWTFRYACHPLFPSDTPEFLLRRSSHLGARTGLYIDRRRTSQAGIASLLFDHWQLIIDPRVTSQVLLDNRRIAARTSPRRESTSRVSAPDRTRRVKLLTASANAIDVPCGAE